MMGEREREREREREFIYVITLAKSETQRHILTQWVQTRLEASHVLWTHTSLLLGTERTLNQRLSLCSLSLSLSFSLSLLSISFVSSFFMYLSLLSLPSSLSRNRQFFFSIPIYYIFFPLRFSSPNPFRHIYFLPSSCTFFSSSSPFLKLFSSLFFFSTPPLISSLLLPSSHHSYLTLPPTSLISISIQIFTVFSLIPSLLPLSSTPFVPPRLLWNSLLLPSTRKSSTSSSSSVLPPLPPPFLHLLHLQPFPSPITHSGT